MSLGYCTPAAVYLNKDAIKLSLISREIVFRNHGTAPLGIFVARDTLTTMRILVVEDEKKVASFIKRGLEATHYSVDVEYDGEAGLKRLLEGEYDLVILDVMLPRLNGLSLMKEIRRQQLNVPILLLTARVTVADKVMGLDLGADDYLTKPFAFEELLARVRALLRRGPPTHPAILTIADLKLDPVTREVSRGNKRIDLTAKEYALLEFLLRRRD